MTQANSGYQILSDMEEAWKTTIPKNPAFDYTYANESILAKFKKRDVWGQIADPTRKIILENTIKVQFQW